MNALINRPTTSDSAALPSSPGLPSVRPRANGTSACWLPSPSCRPASLRRSSMAPRLRTSRSLASPRPCPKQMLIAVASAPTNPPRALCEPVSACNRTGLCPTEMEIGKWRPETGARNPPLKDRNSKNRQSETEARQPNPRECRGFSHPWK
jgi:hypothetical protein